MATPFYYPFLPTHRFHDELIATANAIGAPGKGILAADESTGTIGKRFADIKVDNTRENRREFRRLLFTTPNLNQHISGVITYEETLFDKMEDGKTDLVQPLKEAGIIIGIKNDMGTKTIVGSDNETYTQGLTDLGKRCERYYAQGARFCKWRCVLRISRSTPSALAISQNADILARYAAISQSEGLVPIVEPEILMDGDHSLAICQYWTEKVLTACYAALSLHNVLLEGTLLKPNMCNAGVDFSPQPSTAEVAKATVTALQRTTPAAVPAITFLSGGMSEVKATENLHALNALALGARPWSLTFSFGRALQKSCLAAWQGKKENVAAAQAALMHRAKSNGAAAVGKYEGEGNVSNAGSADNLHVSNYVY
jgi:fructose-bisphosphate aldolase class I